MAGLREISCHVVSETVRDLFIEVNYNLGEDVLDALKHAADTEDSELGRYALERIIENAEIAGRESLPLCQDTGLAVVFVEVGQDVHVVDGDLYEAIESGVREAYSDGFLRKSVCDPLSRENTSDNTPAVIHAEIVMGDKIRIVAMPKGGGSENVSSSIVLLPADGIEGIKKHVVDMVAKAGPNPCPPVIVGVGIGGSLEMSALLSKKALLRPVGDPNTGDDRLSTMESEILREVNALGTGPQGYGGRTTALAVHIEMMPCHIASLPVSVNIQCHVARHGEAII
jgi:fumarate hydratase subunit alpha